jgi:uncharacterized protein (DUF1697 family)
MLVAKQVIKADAAEVIQGRATAGEQARKIGETLWFHFPQGSGTSKLTPALIDKAIGSPATSRNYRTVCTLLDMLDG